MLQSWPAALSAPELVASRVSSGSLRCRNGDDHVLRLASGSHHIHPLSADIQRSGGGMATADGRGGEDLNIDTTGNTVDEEKDNPTQPYHEFVHPAKASKRFGLKGSAPYRYPKGIL